MNLQDQLQEVKDRLAQLDPNNRDNLVEIAKLKAQQAELTNQVAQEEAAQVRIMNLEVKREQWTLPTDLNSFFSSESHLDADGNPYIVTNGNRVVTQIVKDAIRNNDDEWIAKFAELEREKDQLIETLRRDLSQAVIEKEEAENKRDAAIREREDRMIQESADLQQMIAEEEAEKARKAAEDRAKRTVYDVKGDSDIKGVESKNFTAKLAATGETITYNWTQKRYYIELTDENEIWQFRQQHGESELDQADHVEDTTSISDSVAPEVTFPELPSAIAPEAILPPEVQLVISAPTDGGQGQTVEERVAALEKRVVELEKVCNLNEEAA